MKKCRQWMKKNAYWGVSLLLFAAIAGIVCLVTGFNQKEYQIVCLGDSIIGMVRDDTSITAYMEENTGLKVYNGAFGGTSAANLPDYDRIAVGDNVVSLTELVDAICYENFSVQNAGINRYASADYFQECVEGFNDIDWSEVEILVIEHGVNDYMAGVPADNPDAPYDVNTYGGALRNALSLLQEHRPDLRIILCTPVYCWFYADRVSCEERDLGGGYLEDYVSVELAIAEEFQVEVIDNYHESGIGGSFENCDLYTEDGLHLNETGRKLIADRISAVILGEEK